MSIEHRLRGQEETPDVLSWWLARDAGGNLLLRCSGADGKDQDVLSITADGLLLRCHLGAASDVYHALATCDSRVKDATK
jgi:hypothetical protein